MFFVCIVRIARKGVSCFIALYRFCHNTRADADFLIEIPSEALEHRVINGMKLKYAKYNQTFHQPYDRWK